MSTTLAQPSDLLEIALGAAQHGGRLARAAFGRRLEVTRKSDGTEVTEIDQAVERAIIDFLKQRRPDDECIGEEATEAGQVPGETAGSDQERVYWAIDPIDGTRNYIRGVPLFATTVCALRAGMPVAGVIYEPVQEIIYSANESGAFVNGRALKTQNFRDLEKSSQLVVAIPSSQAGQWRQMVQGWIDKLVVRNLGCATLHLAMIAGGQFDAALMTSCKLWDVAAGWLLVTQAGGLISAPDGKALFPIDLAAYRGKAMPCLAAAPEVHAQLIARGA